MGTLGTVKPMAGESGEALQSAGSALFARAAELAEAERLNRRIVERALALDGTCTGEHGVGLGKLDFLPLEHGEAFHVMQQIKATLDPQNLMNPGKVLKQPS